MSTRRGGKTKHRAPHPSESFTLRTPGAAAASPALALSRKNKPATKTPKVRVQGAANSIPRSSPAPAPNRESPSPSIGNTQLTQAIRDAVLDLLSENEFVSKLASLLKSILIPEMEATIAERVLDSLHFDTDSYDEKCLNLDKRIDELECLIDDGDQYSRRNCLIFSGIEETPGEQTDDIILNLCSKDLNVALSSSDIDRSHRLGSREPYPTPSETTKKSGTPQPKKRPRNLIVKFATYHVRHSVYNARSKLKNRQNSKEDDTKIFINENLTRKRSNLFWKVKKAKHDFEDKIWTQDGKILVRGKNGTKITLTRESELNKLDSLKEQKLSVPCVL